MIPNLKFIELPDRTRLQYVERGNPDGVPVVFLHGLTDSWRSFEPVLPYLPESLHIFVLTQRGHGDAGRPAAGYRTRDFATDLAVFMDTVGLAQAIVTGHSMGSTNALRFASDYPGRTLGLVLAGAFASYRNNPVIVEFWETAVARLRDPVDPALAREFQESTLARPLPPELLDTFVQESLKVPALVWRQALAGLLEDDFVSGLSRIAVPALILWGARDAFCPQTDQQTLLAALPDARLVVYEDAGHALHWEEPVRFAADVDEFSKSIVSFKKDHSGYLMGDRNSN